LERSSVIWLHAGAPARTADSFMEQATATIDRLVESSKRFAQRLVVIGENRFELLIVEVQEERRRLLHVIFLALGVATFGFLALLALNVVIVVLLWNLSPVAVLLILAGLYSTGAFYLYRRLAAMLGDWTMLSATLDQLRKDRECLEEKLM